MITHANSKEITKVVKKNLQDEKNSLYQLQNYFFLEIVRTVLGNTHRKSKTIKLNKKSTLINIKKTKTTSFYRHIDYEYTITVDTYIKEKRSRIHG